VAIHETLASGRWRSFSLVEQMAHVGSEVERAIRSHRAGETERFDRALARSLELFDLTIDDPRWRNHRLREIARAREEFCRLFFEGSADTRDAADGLQQYFLYFAIAARRDR
jgi:hypothetical protein